MLIFQNPEFPKRTFGVSVTPDNEVLVISEAQSTSGNALYCAKLNKGFTLDVQKLIDGFDNTYYVQDHQNGNLLIYTNYKAPNYRLVWVNMLNPEKENWKTLIPEQKMVLQSVNLSGGKLLLKYLKDAVNLLRIYNYDGTMEKEIIPPTPGSIHSITSSKDEQVFFYSFNSFLSPSTIYQYDILNHIQDIFEAPKLKFNSNDFVSEQIFYTSKDGTKIPMFLVYKKGL